MGALFVGTPESDTIVFFSKGTRKERSVDAYNRSSPYYITISKDFIKVHNH